jgi:hypothetical protein
MFVMHTPLLQSPALPHALVSSHFGAIPPPPQSTSVSVPFFTMSVNVGAAHVPPLQTFDVQSAPVPQFLPTMHGGASAPPQSTSVSLLSFTPFVAEAAEHVVCTQMPDLQSVPIAHVPPFSHGACALHTTPPGSPPPGLPPGLPPGSPPGLAPVELDVLDIGSDPVSPPLQAA